MTAPARVPQSDITRALKAARAAGYARARLEISPGGAIILTVSDSPAPLPADLDAVQRNEWDEVLTL
jgi:hypothetical protein